MRYRNGERIETIIVKDLTKNEPHFLLGIFQNTTKTKQKVRKYNTTYSTRFLYMTGNVCDIHSHGRYLRAIKLACRRCHVGQHFSIVFTQFDLFLCYILHNVYV